MLHVARDWVRPSEGFVADVLRTTTASVPSLAYGTAWDGVPLPPRASRVPASRPALAAVVVARRAQVLHAHFGYWAAPVAGVARRTGRPWALSLHGHDLLVEGCPAAVRADLVVVPSPYLADAASRAGVHDERIRVVPSGLDLAQLPFRVRTPRADGTVLVTFAGRYVAKKGVLDAADAFAAARDRLPQLRFRFVGHGPLETALRERLAALRLDAELVDGSAPAAVRTALATTDLLLTASRVAGDGDAETLGLVNLEALACGVPVVTTASGGVPYAVGDRARVVAEGSVRDLADALVDLAGDPARWQALGRAGRDHVVRGFELGARVADLEQQWAALAAGRPLPAVEAVRARTPSVSVVLVTAGRRELVGRALDALAAQTLPAQVVVVDNASTDGTADALAARDVTVLTEPVHAHVAAARNRAAAVATGELVAFTDDDCAPTPTWLEGLVASYREGVALVQGRTTADPHARLEPLSRTQWVPAEYGLYETSNVAYAAESFRAAGGFDTGFAAEVARVLGPRFGRYPFGEDTELAWRVKRAGGRSRFAAGAVVEHHVFEPDRSYLLRRAVVGAGWPLLLRRVPELAPLVLEHGVLLGAQRRRVLLALAGA
ncbi:MAG: glycosyl transferase family 1, partial [Frankiales bacterium]|nr:glycosyl transferase family 1 [Frankiales bacterium]